MYAVREMQVRYLVQFQIGFIRSRDILKKVKNVKDRPPVHVKTAHHFLMADFENCRFETEL